MILCLDSVSPADQDELARLLLHGPGTNRWFDKHNLIVARNGNAGVNFEHAVGDGATTLRVVDEMYKWSVANGREGPSKAKPVCAKSSTCSVVRFNTLLRRGRVFFVCYCGWV